MSKENIKPITIHDPATDTDYVLRFTRATVRKMEQNGFDISDIERHPMTRIPELFHGAFLAERPTIKKSVTDDILFNGICGLTDDQLERLGKLYAEPFEYLRSGDDEPNVENPRKMTVQM